MLIDSSVLVKWFHREDEAEVEQAEALRLARRNGVIRARMLDLAVYEVGNVLVKVLEWQPRAVADQLDVLRTVCGDPLVLKTPAGTCGPARLR